MVSIVVELLFFSQVENIIGIFTTFFSLVIFKQVVLRREIIIRRPLSFIAVFGLFLFMYLPIVATLIDGHPISFGMINPIQTFTLQFIYFSITIFAFYKSGKYSIRFRGISNMLKKYNYFTPPTHKQIWVLGFIGLFPKIYLMMNQYGDEMTTGAGFANMLSYLIYLPVILLFPNLYGGKEYKYKKKVFIYIAFITIIAIASNSRNQVLFILATCFLIFIINLIINKPLISIRSIRKTFLIIILVIFFIPMLADLAFAMVAVRSERYGITAKELFNVTWDLYTDKEKLNKLKEIANSDTRIMALNNIHSNWNEYYVNNIFLQRLCNYRVVDASIYHAYNAGIPNKIMQEDFINQLKTTYPTPIVKLLFRNINKEDYKYSPMDLLYAKSQNTALLPSFLVGGDVGLGLSYFGYWYFLVQYIVYFIVFILIDQLHYFSKKTNVISVFSLMTIYTFFLTFQVGGGIIAHIRYIIYSFFISLIAYLMIYKLVRIIIVPKSLMSR